MALARVGAGLSRGDIVLDVGCGWGFPSILLAKRCGKVVGIDTSAEAIAEAGRLLDRMRGILDGRIDVAFRRTDLEGAGFPEGTFDKVFSICVLEHIPRHRDVLEQARRRSRTGPCTGSGNLPGRQVPPVRRG